MRHRIYKVKNTGEVVVDTPSPKYQNENFDKCPHPWRFRESNPDREDFEMEVITKGQLRAISETKNEAGSAQFYYDASGKLKHDHNWDECEMPVPCVLKRHRDKLERELEEELSKESPDPAKVIRKDRELKKLGKLSEQEVYELALSKLEAEGKKPKIQEKLRRKIEALGK